MFLKNNDIFEGKDALIVLELSWNAGMYIVYLNN